MLLEQIRRGDCDRCKLRTEHYILYENGTLRVYRCLRCGHTKELVHLSEEDREAFPPDDAKPVYVL